MVKLDLKRSQSTIKTKGCSEQNTSIYMVIIKTPPPIYEISKLKVKGAIAVYALLFESAFKETNYDRRYYLPWEYRRDTGGTTYWSIKAMAETLMLGKATVIKAIDALLEHGFISIAGYFALGKCSKQRIFRVTTVDQIEARRAAIEILGKARPDEPERLLHKSHSYNDLGGLCAS